MFHVEHPAGPRAPDPPLHAPPGPHRPLATRWRPPPQGSASCVAPPDGVGDLTEPARRPGSHGGPNEGRDPEHFPVPRPLKPPGQTSQPFAPRAHGSATAADCSTWNIDTRATPSVVENQARSWSPRTACPDFGHQIGHQGPPEHDPAVSLQIPAPRMVRGDNVENSPEPPNTWPPLASALPTGTPPLDRAGRSTTTHSGRGQIRPTSWERSDHRSAPDPLARHSRE